MSFNRCNSCSYLGEAFNLFLVNITLKIVSDQKAAIITGLWMLQIQVQIIYSLGSDQGHMKTVVDLLYL